MATKQIILVGAGGHAKACIDVIEQAGEYQIAGLVGTASELNTTLLGYPIFATDDDLPDLVNDYSYALIAVGQIKTSEPRSRLFKRLNEVGFRMPVIISTRAYVSRHATINEGTIIMHGAIVNAGAVVASNCIINTNSLIEHDCNIATHCHISTGATLNGNVTIKQGSFIGSHSVIKEGTTIGVNCLIGMGLTVRKNLPDSSTYLGESGHVH